MSSTAVVLFTRDLRVHDQRALSAAADRGGTVVPLFVLDDSLWRTGAGANRRLFLRDALADLRDSLRRLGGDLVVRRGDAVDETLRMARATGAETILVGDDVSGYAQTRRRRLVGVCRRERLELVVEDTIGAVPIGDLAPAQSDHYRRFTPYWRRWRDAPSPAVLDAPARIELPKGVPVGRLPPRAELFADRSSPDLPSGGEAAGRRRLVRWLRDGIHEYDARRDVLAIEGTSRLSPYFHFGCVSAREAVERARSHGRVADEFVRQLCWRDFFLQLLGANPETVREDLRSREPDWRDDDEGFARWSAGRTGVPIVDAAMRQLRQEGWMHNRGRLVAGSLLTKMLGVDWRRGADVFFDLLVDGDVASNIGNWQWVAGTGADTRPNRTFNPVRQAKRFDRDGAYVRRYVAELRDIEDAYVHEPWRAPRAARPADYPAPVVDVTTMGSARSRARGAR
jgi:deoxyribodipyrimidine photo-lyase